MSRVKSALSSRERTVADRFGGELYTDGKTLVTLAVHDQRRRSSNLLRAVRRELTPAPLESYRLEVNALGSRWECSAVAPVLSVIQRVLDIRMSPFFYESTRFEELKAEGRESPGEANTDEVKASEVLSLKVTRWPAQTGTAAGGLVLGLYPITELQTAGNLL